MLTTQREFAQRVLAGPGTRAYGALSVFFARVCRRGRLMSIPPEQFRPRPRVVSLAFVLERLDRPLFPVADDVLFRRVVKAAFAQRRKQVANSLAAALAMDRRSVDAVLDRCGIDARARGETLSPQDFNRLYLGFRSAVD